MVERNEYDAVVGYDDGVTRAYKDSAVASQVELADLHKLPVG